MPQGLPDLADLTILHALLIRDAAVDKVEAKRLLHRYHDLLLRTLECSPSAERPGAPEKMPAFPSPADEASSPTTHAASTLLQCDARAADQLLVQLKRRAYNDAQVAAVVAALDFAIAERGLKEYSDFLPL